MSAQAEKPTKGVIVTEKFKQVSQKLNGDWRIDLRKFNDNKHGDSFSINNKDLDASIFVRWGYGCKGNKVELSLYVCDKRYKYNNIGVSADRSAISLAKDIENRLLGDIKEVYEKRSAERAAANVINDNLQLRCDAMRKLFNWPLHETVANRQYNNGFYECMSFATRNFAGTNPYVRVGLGKSHSKINLNLANLPEVLACQVIGLITAYNDKEQVFND